MKKLLSLLFILIAFQSMAQTQEIGVRSGVPTYMYSMSEGKEALSLMPAWEAPVINVYFRDGIRDHLFWEAGLAWYRPALTTGAEILFFDETVTQRFSNLLFQAMSLNGAIGSEFKMVSNLYLDLQTGLSVDYYFDPVPAQSGGGYVGDTHVTYSIDEDALKTDINMHIQNRLSLCWKTGFNLNFTLSAAWFTGLFDTWESSKTYELHATESSAEYYEPDFYSRGSYWLVDAGIAWRFGK